MAVDLAPASQANANASVLSSMGVSISPLPVSLNRLVAAADLVNPQTIASSQIMGDVAESFNLDNPPSQQSGSNESIINVHLEQQGAFTAYAGNLANQLLGDEFRGFNIAAPTTSTPQSGIGAENWSILTDIVFNQAQLSAETLVCRLVDIQG